MQMNQKGTWQLILMAREGDRSAIDSLFFSSFPSAYLISYNITGSKDESLRILSDIYTNVFSNLDAVDSSEAFVKKIHKMVYDVTVNDEKYGKSLSRDGTLCEKAGLFSADSACFHDFNTVRGIETAATADCVFSVLNTISLEKRICLYLYYFVTDSPAEIAEIVSSDENQVKGALASAFSETEMLIDRVCEKADILKYVSRKAVILWALRNTKAFSVSSEETDVFYSALIKVLVESSFLDSPMTNSATDDGNFNMQSMRLTSKKKEVFRSIFNMRNLIIVLVLTVAAVLVVTMNKLSDYNDRRQEREALTSRTTLRYRTTAPSSERVIFSTEYSYPDINDLTDISDETETEPLSEEATRGVSEEETESVREQSDFEYIETGSTVTITGYNGSGINITVPEKLNGKKVTAIGEGAFYNSEIVNVNLPTTVTTIGKNAFYGCVEMQAIKLPMGVTAIGSDAFRGCANLGSVSLPSTLKSIGSNAFYKCYELKAIALPSTLTTIGDWAFAYCSTLTGVTVPKSVSSVGASVFYGCESLKKCSFESPSKVQNLGDSFFFGCSSLESVVLPSQVKVIPANCFYGCKSLETVPLSAVTHINESAFEGCESLKTVNFSTSLLKIENSAFAGCYSIKEIKLPPNTLSLGEEAFSECTSLTRIYIPSSVTRIGENAFRGCTMIQIDCSSGSFAESYAKKNSIQLYGKENSENDM